MARPRPKGGTAAVLDHPLRPRILETMAIASKMSPSELRATLDPPVPLGVISYHVRQLHGAGLIRKAGTRPRRGAVEHFYELNPPETRKAADALRKLADRLDPPVSGGVTRVEDLDRETYRDMDADDRAQEHAG